MVQELLPIQLHQSSQPLSSLVVLLITLWVSRYISYLVISLVEITAGEVGTAVAQLLVDVPRI